MKTHFSFSKRQWLILGGMGVVVVTVALFAKSPHNPLVQGIQTTSSVLLAGDVMLDRHVNVLLDRRGLRGLLSPETMELLRSHALVFFNLEGPVTARRTCRANLCFAFRERWLRDWSEITSSVATIANNHILDQGYSGYEDALKALQRLGIPFVGHVREDTHVYRTFIGPRKATFLGYADFGRVPLGRIVESVKQEARSADLVLVAVHFGSEYQTTPSSRQRMVAHALVDAGADVVVGHHPHVIQPMEVYHGRPIFYSLGNFVFDQYFSKETMRGLLVEMFVTPSGMLVRPLLSQTLRNGTVTIERSLGNVADRIFRDLPELRVQYEREGSFVLKGL